MLPSSTERGFYLIGMLIALIFVMYLTSMYFTPGPAGQPSTYVDSMNKAHKMDCNMTRNKIAGNIVEFKMLNPTAPATIDNLLKTNFQIPPCRAGGTYSIDQKGVVHCSVHNPVGGPTPTPAAGGAAPPAQ